MIPCNRIIYRFEEIIGWPYQSPGSNDQNGIDCSGAFVRAFRLEGSSIYHGSNRIIRVHCRIVTHIKSASDLKPGMAVFKGREDASRLSASYKPGGKYHDPALPLDYYHIGLVAGTSPLRIIHATSPNAKVDSVIGKWLMAGYLLGVDYAEESETEVAENKEAYVTAQTGSTVNFRQQPKDGAALVIRSPRLPVGTKVSVLSPDGSWTKVNYNGAIGYIKSEFLKVGGLDTETRIASLEARVQVLETNMKREVITNG